MVTVRTYWAWEATATLRLRLLGGARGTHGGGEGRGHIVSPRAQLVSFKVVPFSLLYKEGRYLDLFVFFCFFFTLFF